jgi:hypothetical protein
MKRICLVFFAWALAAAGAAQAASVSVETAMVKVRPGDAAPAGTGAALSAAANEFEPFQIVIDGEATGATGVSASVSDLVGPGGAVIPAAGIMLYREGLYNVAVPSNSEGAVGPWPDPLVPGVDAYFSETRNAFPFDVPAGELRAVWVEVFVPPGTPAGEFTGAVTVSGEGLTETAVDVNLLVRGFELPSTATLKSAFGVRWNVCAAHLGSYEACGDVGIEDYLVLYGRAALDHRVSLEAVIYYGPDGADWSRFDSRYGPLLDGTAPTRLAGARQTTIRMMGDDSQLQAWHDHFEAEGWLDRLFDYTCDEPPMGCDWSEIPVRAAPVHTAGIRTLLTTNIAELTSHDLLDDIDIIVPVVNHLHDKGGSSTRPDYDAFLASGAGKELWMYQSCMSHGCGDGCVETTDDYFTGWPSTMIDVSAMQNRAMEWISFIYDVGGELYFETTYDLPTAWDDQCDFSGNGDGTLFYPGTPARIGGTSHIPVESIRLKLIREGMEDYEYLHTLCGLGDCEMARAEAGALFAAPYESDAASPADLYAARSRIAARIEELLGTTPSDEGPDAVEPLPEGDAVEPVDGVEGAEGTDATSDVDGAPDAVADTAEGEGDGGGDGGCGCRIAVR